LLIGLCFLCFAAGLQTATALETWFHPSTSLKLTSDILKAVAPLALASVCVVLFFIRKRIMSSSTLSLLLLIGLCFLCFAAGLQTATALETWFHPSTSLKLTSDVLKAVAPLALALVVFVRLYLLIKR